MNEDSPWFKAMQATAPTMYGTFPELQKQMSLAKSQRQPFGQQHDAPLEFPAPDLTQPKVLPPWYMRG